MNQTLKDIECINYEAQQFLVALGKFRDNLNAIDPTLCNNLLDIVSEIENFLGSKPEEIESATVEQLTPDNLDKFGVYKAFVCRQCGVEFGDSLQSVRDHLSAGHQEQKSRNNWRQKNRKPLDDNRLPHKKRTPNKPKNQNLPKSNYYRGNYPHRSGLTPYLLPEVKSLFFNDLAKFFETRLDIAEKLITLPQYQSLENDLLTVLRTIYPGLPIKFYFFGSRISGIGNIHSDLDIFVDIDNVFEVYENPSSDLTIRKITSVGEAIHKTDNWVRLACIRNARVPIIRAIHTTTKLNCDIGFSNSLGFCNTKLVRYLLGLQPIAKAMVIFLKHWCEKAKIEEGLNTYATTLMVITYLQTKKMLPTIKELQDCLEEPLEIGPWSAAFAEKSLAELNLAPAPQCYLNSFEREMRDFFVFYGNYNFQHYLVCPYLGEVVPQKNLETNPRLERYVNFIKANPDRLCMLFKRTVMMVQDPFELNNNTSKGVTDACVTRLQHYFLLSAELLTARIGKQPAESDGSK